MKATSYLIPAVAVLAVVSIFLIFMPAQPGALYWVNFVWAAACAGGVPLYFTQVSTKGGKVSTAVSIAIGTYLLLYALMLVVLMTAHFALVEPGVIWVLADFPSPCARLLARLVPLFTENPQLGQGIYYSLFIALTAASAIVIMFLLRADAEHVAYQQELTVHTARQRNYASDMLQAACTLAQTCRRENFSFAKSAPGQTPLHRVATAFAALTPNVVKHLNAASVLSALTDEAGSYAALKEVAAHEEEITRWADAAMEQLAILRQQARS